MTEAGPEIGEALAHGGKPVFQTVKEAARQLADFLAKQEPTSFVGYWRDRDWWELDRISHDLAEPEVDGNR